MQYMIKNMGECRICMLLFLITLPISGMDQRGPLDRLKRQSEQLVDMVVQAKQASIKILKFYQSIEEYVDQAAEGAYGLIAKNNAIIVQSNINKIQSSVVNMEKALRNTLRMVKITQGNVLWAYLAAVEFCRSKNQLAPSLSEIGHHIDICNQYKISIDDIEQLFSHKREGNIAYSIFKLKCLMYHVIVAVKSIQCFHDEACYGLSAKKIMQAAQRYASQALDSELSVERNASNIDWYITTVENFASRVMKERQEEENKAALVVSMQDLHV